YKDAEGTLVGGDHLAFYTAAHYILDGQQAEMYGGNLHEYQQSLIGWDWVGVEGYRNPPFYALLYVPTARFSFYTSFLIWTGINFALLALSIFLLKPDRPWRVLGWALAFYPVFATISFGQNTMLSLAVFAGVYRLLDANRFFAAGLLAGLLWFKPPLLIGLFIWWAFSPRRYLACWVGVSATGFALAALSFLALPEASWAFVRTLRGNLGYGGEGMWNKHTPKAFFEMLIPGVPAVIWALTLVLTAISIALAWRVYRRSGAPVAVMFPVAVFLSLWASPHALIYEWALVVAAAVVLWHRFPASRDVWLCLFALAWLALGVSTTLSLVLIRHLELPIAVQISIPILGFVGWRAARELLGCGQLDVTDEHGVAGGMCGVEAEMAAAGDDKRT
ncbi:MAG TPA: glycosyltransferase family 87 protein, partial [Gemmata sp.]|nr:glycosyltransferase family 87 protein [Gemmata sp.]